MDLFIDDSKENRRLLRNAKCFLFLTLTAWFVSTLLLVYHFFMGSNLDVYSKLYLVLVVQSLFLVIAVMGNLFFILSIFYWQKIKLKT